MKRSLAVFSKRPIFYSLVAAVFSSIIAFCNVAQAEDKDKDKNVEKAAEKAGDEMNYAEKYLEDYGSINISAPLLSKLGEDFSFNLKQGGTNYYTDAKNQVQGAAASFQQTVQSFSLAAQGQMDPTIAAAYAAQLQNYFSNLQRYHTKQNLYDQAALQQLNASLSEANTNTDATARSSATAQALQAYAQQYAAPTNSPVFPTDAELNTNLPAPATGLAKRPDVTNVLSSQQFAPFQGLLSGLNVQPTISDRNAIITAAGDVATESIFRHFMGNTNLDSQSVEENVFFGFSTVSVTPGWRTSKGYAAEAVVATEVRYEPARRSVKEKFINSITNRLSHAAIVKLRADLGFEPTPPEWNGRIRKKAATELRNLMFMNQNGAGNVEEDPNKLISSFSFDFVKSDIPPSLWLDTDTFPNTPVAVTIISPLIDSQVLDLSSSSRSQMEFALALSFALRSAGYAVQADAFEKFVKNKQFDIRTRAPQVAVNAFSSSDGKFGFQIGPRLSAIGDPSNKSGKPDQTLERQSFPALLILRLGAADLSARLKFTDASRKSVELLEPTINFTQTRRWTPIKYSLFRDYPWFRPSDWLHQPITERTRLVAAAKLVNARNQLKKTSFSESVSNAVMERISNLESAMVGDKGHIYLSAKDIVQGSTKRNTVASITNVIPSSITIDPKKTNTFSFAFFGTDLEQINTGAAPSETIPSTPGVVSNSFVHVGKALVAYVTFPTNASASVVFRLQLTNKMGTILTLPIQVDRMKDSGQSAIGPTISFDRTFGNSTLTNTFVTNVFFTNVIVMESNKTTKATQVLSNTTVTNKIVINIVTTNSVGPLYNERYNISISTNSTDSQVNTGAGIIKSELEKNKPNGNSPSNNVLSILVSDNKPSSVAVTNAITTTVSGGTSGK